MATQATLQAIWDYMTAQGAPGTDSTVGIPVANIKAATGATDQDITDAQVADTIVEADNPGMFVIGGTNPGFVPPADCCAEAVADHPKAAGINPAIVAGLQLVKDKLCATDTPCINEVKVGLDSTGLTLAQYQEAIDTIEVSQAALIDCFATMNPSLDQAALTALSDAFGNIVAGSTALAAKYNDPAA